MGPSIFFVFQSTLPQGERLDGLEEWRDNLDISIHAPARGATGGNKKAYKSSRNFNPRSRKGSDEPYFFTAFTNFIFQSTLPQGERLRKLLRPTVGICISIHAPARGATVGLSHALVPVRISIHAPARGATYTSDPTIEQNIDFNPRSRKGSDIERNSYLD